MPNLPMAPDPHSRSFAEPDNRPSVARDELAGSVPLQADTDPSNEAAQLLLRLGWDEGQRIQTRIYAHMPPARKMEIALRWRAMQIEMLRRQLQVENPDMSSEGIHALLLRRIDWAREPRY